MTESLAHDPWDINCEQHLLGACLRDNSHIPLASADLDGAHFYDPLHGRLFDTITHLSADGPVTPVLLHAVLKSDPGVVETGGLAYLEALYSGAPSRPPIREYVAVLLDLAMRRELMRIADDLRREATEPPSDGTARQVADRATEALLSAGRASAPPPITPYEIAQESLRECEAVAQGKVAPMIKTGWARLDDEIGGLRGGDLVVVPAKSGMGKSAFLGGMALNAARAGVPTLVFSLEMTRRQWVERMVCDIDFDTARKAMWYSRVRNGRLTAEEFDRFFLASGKLDGLPLEIHDSDDVTIQQIQSRARAFKAKHAGKMGLILLDYLQIVAPTDARENRERQVGIIARGAKSMAKMLDWPVVAGSQMNEGGAMRSKEEQRPQAADVRESRGVMNEADLMLSPYRPAWFVENRKPDASPGDPAWVAWKAELAGVQNRFDLLCLKNRNGRRFDLELFCEMGASAIRDEAPLRRRSEPDQAAADLLETI
jgi:replicative DNA helicase